MLSDENNPLSLYETSPRRLRVMPWSCQRVMSTHLCAQDSASQQLEVWKQFRCEIDDAEDVHACTHDDEQDDVCG